MNMLKNQNIILIIIVVIILGVLIGWGLMQKEKTTSEEETSQEEELEEVFSISAVVQSVDAENNFLMVLPANQEKEVKVVVGETTKLIKLEFPFDPANPPYEATFTPKQTEIEISDFVQSDNVFIKAKENIAGKTEISNIDFVHVLP